MKLVLGKDFRVKNTMYLHKNIHKGTWMSPDVNHTYQINHILVNERFVNNIINVRTYREVYCESEPFLVVSKFRVKLKQ